jgi:hypothetical protein
MAGAMTNCEASGTFLLPQAALEDAHPEANQARVASIRDVVDISNRRNVSGRAARRL